MADKATGKGERPPTGAKIGVNIAIERLRFRKRKGEWSRKSVRKVNWIPYGFFRHALKHVAEREGVVV